MVISVVSQEMIITGRTVSCYPEGQRIKRTNKNSLLGIATEVQIGDTLIWGKKNKWPGNNEFTFKILLFQRLE